VQVLYALLTKKTPFFACFQISLSSCTKLNKWVFRIRVFRTPNYIIIIIIIVDVVVIIIIIKKGGSFKSCWQEFLICLFIYW